MHGGNIKVKSEGLGCGSEFILTWPIVVPSENSSIEKNAPTLHSCVQEATHSRILIVDDNHDACDTLSTLFEADGYSVTVAYDGYQAVEVAQGVLPETIILDIGLQGIDGYEAARRIRMLPGGEKI